jgi:hypothetical protein
MQIAFNRSQYRFIPTSPACELDSMTEREVAYRSLDNYGSWRHRIVCKSEQTMAVSHGMVAILGIVSMLLTKGARTTVGMTQKEQNEY